MPKGKILRPDGTDVSTRDRSDDGAIILRRGVEKGHNYVFGSFPLAPWKEPMEVRLSGSSGKVAIVERQDYERVAQFNWFLHPQGYALRNHTIKRDGTRKGTQMMHRLIIDAKLEDEVDHINGDFLDNRRANLRLVSHQQNAFNMKKRRLGLSKYKGVTKKILAKTKPWRARIRHNGRLLQIGYYATEREAAQAYDERASELFGEHAALNFARERSKRGIDEN